MRKTFPLVGVVIVAIGSSILGFYVYRHQAEALSAPSEPPQLVVFDGQQEITGLYRPDFSLADVNGQIRNISEWDGLVIALNFWATWCPPCLKEIPEFIELQSKYADRGLQFIGIALQGAEEVTEFMREQGMNYPVLAGELEVIKLAESYGNHIGALPYTVIIDREGLITYVKFGQLSRKDAEEIISGLL